MFGLWSGDWFGDWFGVVEVEIDNGLGGPSVVKRVVLDKDLLANNRIDREILYMTQALLMAIDE